MLKKILLAAIATTTFSLSAVALANSFYVGPTIMIQDSMTNSSAYRGVNPKMTFGYGGVGDEAYFGGEIFAIPGSASLTDTHLPGAESAKMSRSFGASIIPGMAIAAQTVGFARLGFITTKFTGPNIYKTGGQIGLGMQTAVSPNWDVRGEYDYTVYGSVGQIGSPKVDEYSLGFLYRLED